MSESKDVVNYDELLAEMAKAATAIERPTTSTIGTKSGVISYNGTPCPDNKLDCIIIASTYQNLYYDKKWDPANPANPICWAYSEDGENMAPGPKVTSPQHTDCATCPHNQWNSDPEGGKGKACKNSRKLALVPAATSAEDMQTAEVATMAIPVTSVKDWGMYVNKLDALFHRPPLGVITTIGSKPDVKTTFKITFQNGPLVPNEMLLPLFGKAKDIKAKQILDRDYDPNPEPTAEDEEAAAKKAARSKKF